MFNILDFGAVGDGQTLNTKAIQQALDACGAAGGGEVLVPAGRFVTGTLLVRSFTTLILAPGAVLAGSPNINDYYLDPADRSGDMTGRHLLYLNRVERVTITGGGTIDGQGQAFWDSPEDPVDGKFPWRGYYLARSPHDQRPSPMLQVAHARDVHIQNITLTNPAGWTLHLLDCERVWVNGINIANSMIAPNSDGIDITSSRDVMISDCHIVNGDDCIVFFANERYGPCERIAVNNCVLSSRTCGIKFHGFEASVYRQVTCNSIVVYNSERAFSIYIHGKGLCEDVHCSNWVVQTGCTPPNFSERPLHIDVRRADSTEWRKSSGGLGRLRGISFDNMVIRSPGRILLAAEHEAPIENLSLTNITLQVSGPQDLQGFLNPTPSLGQHNRSLPHIRTAAAHVVLHGVKGALLSNIRVFNAADQPLQGMHGLWLEHVEDARVADFNTYPLQEGYQAIYQPQAEGESA